MCGDGGGGGSRGCGGRFSDSMARGFLAGEARQIGESSGRSLIMYYTRREGGSLGWCAEDHGI